MTFSTAVLLLSSGVLLQADPDHDHVIRRLRDHFSEIRSIHVRGIERGVKEGGLTAKDPAVARPVYEPGLVREVDLWLDPPRQRVLRTERRGAAKTVTEVYFDGQTYTNLDPVGRTGLVLKGGSLVTPPGHGPLHAIGYCYPGTYQTSLAALLADPSKVTVERGKGADGKTEWVVQIKSIPGDVQPRGLSEKARRLTLVRIWATLDPQVMIHRWAIYYPQSGDKKIDSSFGKPVPLLQIEGYLLRHGFINLYDPKGFRQKVGDRIVRLPRRILHGNGKATAECVIQEWAINPRPSRETFLPTIPAGYSLTRRGDQGEKEVSLTGGHAGVTLKVSEITKEAKGLLATGESLQAPPQGFSAWMIPIASALLVVGGTAIGFFVWRRRKT